MMIDEKSMNTWNLRKINIIVTVSLLILFNAILIMRSGRFSKEPKVEVVADNCYDRTIRVITDQDYRPYSFYGSDGAFSGHDVELITMIANELHMNLDLQFMGWDDGIRAINAGLADVLMTCDYSDSFPGVDRLLKSEPVSYDEFLVYSKQKVDSQNMLYGSKTIAVMKNGNAMAELNKMQLTRQCIEYPDNRSAMQALINDEADFAIMRQNVGSVLIQEMAISGISGYVSLGQSNMCFGINSSNPELVTQINGVLEMLKETGTLDRLKDKWLTTFVKPYTMAEILSNNVWLVCIFVSLIIITIFASLRTGIQKKRSEEEHLRSWQVVELLSQDFSCVNYVPLTANPKQDPVINYRVSQQLKKVIPGWDKERSFSHKLDLLCDNLVYEPDREPFHINTRRAKVLAALQESDVYYVNTRVFVDDEIQYYQMKFSSVKENGVLKAIVAGLHSVDIQTKKEMALQEKLQEALKNEEIANRAKTDFLFNMSHDIRTPLNAISGFTSMAIKYIDNREKALDCLSKTQQSGNLLLSLINSVLDVSRIESGKAVLDLRNADVMFSFSGIEATMQELAQSREITLTFTMGNIRDRYVCCDMNRCNRIFVNIVSNALKYTNAGGYVNAFCEQLDEAPEGYGLYRYTFEDNGIGMSDEFQKHVFEKFSREETVTVGNIQGTGLGMAVCKTFVELMGGTIECSSTLGKGTLFTVTLPFKLQEAAFSNPEAEEVALYSFEGKRALVVDDSALNREIAADILSEKGLAVETASDGTDAVSMLEEKGADYFDFVLMDIRMPVLGGYEATRKIRAMYPDRRIPIIALSANAFEEDKAASLEAGMDGHVAKPINVQELFDVLSRFQ